MSRIVQLHGGPWHGQQVSVPSGRDHFHIIMPVLDALTRTPEQPTPVDTKEGIYSQVGHAGWINDFEWDGFVTHE